MTSQKLKICSALLFILCLCHKVAAVELMSFTWDNDLFVGGDSGYTNGMYISWFKVGGMQDNREHSGLIDSYDALPEKGLLLKPFSWTMPKSEPLFAVNAYTLGQIMITPEDLTTTTPNPEGLPYSGQLFLTSIYVAAQDNIADKLSLTLGVIGPNSMADDTQHFIHNLTDSEAPRGWDSQVDNRLVLQLARGKMWRTWLSDQSGLGADFIFDTEVNLGTVEGSIKASAILRFGSDLKHTFITPAFNATRTSNPVSVEGGWFVYAGVTASYIDYQYLIEGDTPSNYYTNELDNTQSGLIAGITYSWDYLALSLAVTDYLLKDDADGADGASRFGTLTIGWSI